MGRKEGSGAHDVGMVGRRNLMEQLPIQLHGSPFRERRPLWQPIHRRGEGITLGKRPRSSQGDRTFVPRKDRIPRFAYAPFKALDVERILAGGNVATADVVLAPQYLTSNSEGVRQRQLWGTEEYTDDSDLVAMLIQTGHFMPPAARPSSFDHLVVRLRVERHISRVSPPFPAGDSNGIRSRAWGSAYEGARISIVRVSTVKGLEETPLAKPSLAAIRFGIPHLVPWTCDDSAKNAMAPGLPLKDDVPPVVAQQPKSPTPSKNPRTERGMPKATVLFDLTNEPCLSYTLSIVADKGNDPELWPSKRLKSEALYVETLRSRFEICSVPRESAETVGDKPFVRFGRVKSDTLNRLLMKNSTLTWAKDAQSAKNVDNVSPVPLPEGDLDIIHKRIEWSSLSWDPSGITVGTTYYKLKKVAFRKHTSINQAATATAAASAENK